MKSNRVKLEELLADDSFCRWLNETATPKETEYWDSWLASQPGNRHIVSLANQYLNFPFRNTQVTQEEITGELDALSARIDDFEKETSSQIKNTAGAIHGRTHTFFTKRDAIPRYAWAAIIALTVGVMALFYHFRGNRNVGRQVDLVQYDTVHVPYGRHKILTLADGSKIVLNANSSLRYPLKTARQSRTDVWLDGEAYFSVVHNPAGKQRVFRIHTNEGVITDLGTKFAVNTWNNATRVVLVKGKVGIQLHHSEGENRVFTEMLPGEMVQFTDTTRNIQVAKVNTDVYTSWIHNKLVFDNTPLREAIQEIEKYYGVHIMVEDKTILDQKISGTIQNSDLNAVLNGVSRILDLKVDYQNDIITLKKRIKESK